MTSCSTILIHTSGPPPRLKFLQQNDAVIKPSVHFLYTCSSSTYPFIDLRFSSNKSFTSKLQQHPPESLCCHQSAADQAAARHPAEEAQELLQDQTPDQPDQHRHTHAQLGLHLLAEQQKFMRLIHNITTFMRKGQHSVHSKFSFKKTECVRVTKNNCHIPSVSFLLK